MNINETGSHVTRRDELRQKKRKGPNVFLVTPTHNSVVFFICSLSQCK